MNLSLKTKCRVIRAHQPALEWVWSIFEAHNEWPKFCTTAARYHVSDRQGKYIVLTAKWGYEYKDKLDWLLSSSQIPSNSFPDPTKNKRSTGSTPADS